MPYHFVHTWLLTQSLNGFCLPGLAKSGILDDKVVAVIYLNSRDLRGQLEKNKIVASQLLESLLRLRCAVVETWYLAPHGARKLDDDESGPMALL